MEFTAIFPLLLCLITWAFFHLLNSISNSRKSAKLPPGPYPLPVIGNILHLGPNPHQSLSKLSKPYGPLMHLKLGSLHTVVVSSPEIAKQILQKYGHFFPGRLTVSAAKAHDHHKASVACLPVGPQWRVLRKICREQMFSGQRLDESRCLREEKLRELIAYVQDCCVNGKVVDVGEVAFVTSLNLISNTLFSVDFAEYDRGSCRELKETVHGFMGVLGRPNFGDYFPMIGWFDPQGIKRESEYYMGKLLAIFDGVIDERSVGLGEKSPGKNDMLEALMEISRGNQAELSRNDIKHLLLDLFVAGTDTSAGTVEWAMTELLRNPKVMSKTKNEIRTVCGENKQVEESDISNLPYLQAVIKETFRYHPPGPFLFRGKADDCDLEIDDNFIIPKNALILINIWAIGRDATVWPNPDSFEPERFLNGENIDLKGHNFELIPFGAGKRICPGLPLAYRMVHLMVASLIHNFDWKLEPGIGPEDVDMNEKFGLSLVKDVPLKAVPIKLSPLQPSNK